MRRSVFLLSVSIILALSLVACSGGQMSMQTPPASNSATTNVSVSIGDAPPTGVTILRFELQVTSASLQRFFQPIGRLHAQQAPGC